MKNTKIKIMLSFAIFLSSISFVNAAPSSLYVSPASANKGTNENFIVTIGVNSSGNKICGAEGTLVFNNLSCQSITMASGLITQSTPTCSNPYFLVGIPSCTTVDSTLFTVSVKTGSAGMASVGATGVDVIGEGKSVGSASISGAYTINATVVPTPTPTPVVSKPIIPVTSKLPTTSNTQNDGYIGYINGKVETFSTLEAAQQAGATQIEPNYKRYPAGISTTTNEEVIPLLATVGTTNIIIDGALKYIIGIIILLIVGYSGYVYKKKKNTSKI